MKREAATATEKTEQVQQGKEGWLEKYWLRKKGEKQRGEHTSGRDQTKHNKNTKIQENKHRREEYSKGQKFI